MFGLGPTELVIILVIVLIIFGPRRLPELGKTFGRGLSELRKASSSEDDNDDNEVDMEEDEERE